MVQWHIDSKTKSTGSGGHNNGIRKSDKLLAHRGGLFSNTVVETEDLAELVSTRGSTSKQRIKKAHIISIADPKTKKIQKGELVSVVENNADRLYVRRNIITKGSTVKVNLGNSEKFVKITSRPGQAGVIQGVLTEAPKQKAEVSKKKEKPQSKPKKTEKTKTSANKIESTKQKA